jgi:hypothetical protein
LPVKVFQNIWFFKLRREIIASKMSSHAGSKDTCLKVSISKIMGRWVLIDG